jgi:hypothetical protein
MAGIIKQFLIIAVTLMLVYIPVSSGTNMWTIILIK